MIKIYVNSPMTRDANSFWRCMGPLSDLMKQSGGEIEVYTPVAGEQVYWDKICQYDLIFFHRPCTQNDFVLLQIAKNLNLPVWSDYDDWLFQLPEWNGNRAIYDNPQMQNYIAHFIAVSDVVSVSTTALQKAFSKVNDNVILIPNAYPSHLFPYRKKKTPARKPTFVWRGTNTHEGDLLDVMGGLKILADPPDLDVKAPIHFFGAPPFSVLNELKPGSFRVYGAVDPLLYWKNLYQHSAKAMLFPLKHCFFNECKSNIAWIEALHAGMLVVAPDLPEWRHPGVFNYHPGDSESFYYAAKEIMDLDADTYEEQITTAYEYMLSKYDSSVVGKLREAVVRSLLSSEFKRNEKDHSNSMVGLWALNVLKGNSLQPGSQVSLEDGQQNQPV